MSCRLSDGTLGNADRLVSCLRHGWVNWDEVTEGLPFLKMTLLGPYSGIWHWRPSLKCGDGRSQQCGEASAGVYIVIAHAKWQSLLRCEVLIPAPLNQLGCGALIEAGPPVLDVCADTRRVDAGLIAWEIQAQLIALRLWNADISMPIGVSRLLCGLTRGLIVHLSSPLPRRNSMLVEIVCFR